MSGPHPGWQNDTPQAISPSHQALIPGSPRRDTNLDRPLPPLPHGPSASPSTYEIPSLRRKPAPKTSTADSEKHARSPSHTFPGIFGSRKSKSTNQHETNVDSAQGHVEHPSIKQSGGLAGQPKVPVADQKPITGKCMTCDSTVRWPRGLKVFRCTTCLMINDLEPNDSHDTRDGWSTSSRKSTAISLDRTRKLISHCIDAYLQHKLRNPTQPPNEATSQKHTAALTSVTTKSLHEAHDAQFSSSYSNSSRARSYSETQNSLQRPSHGSNRQLSDGPTGNVPGRTTDGRQSSSTPVESRRRGETEGVPEEQPLDLDSAIFRPLEAYISSCFTGCTPLNISFFSVRPNTDSDNQGDREKKFERQPSKPSTMPPFKSDNLISPLDAKTLLLGDVAENGSWWSGRPSPKDEETRDHSPERWRGIVSVKTPRINWKELREWYRTIIHATEGWQQRWQALRPAYDAADLSRWESVPLDDLEHELGGSQLHLQRLLLKVTENLLKRPRRPLKGPEDCRFLVMLLANPLLYPSYQSSTTTFAYPSTKGNGDNQEGSSKTTQSTSRIHPEIAPKKVTGSQHTGILKRIFGLVSNLPNEIHQFLVSWFSRFADSQFQSLVELVGSFVTYRLSRQHERKIKESIHPTEGLVPSFNDSGMRHPSQLHAALELQSNKKNQKKQPNQPKIGVYGEDWQMKAAARVMSILFQANIGHTARRRDITISKEQRLRSAGLNAKYHAYSHGQILPICYFYNSVLDNADLVGDFEAWEKTKARFTFCQYPFFLSIWAKIHILEHDARRQMEVKAREAFFDSILSRKAVSQYLVLRVRRDCLADDSLRSVSEVIGSGSSDIKKGLRIDFVGEEGVDVGGLRKEWFLLLVREIFDPQHGLFVYDDLSQYCYFNPFCFESSEQFFLVGVLLGLAIYNSTILDVAFPPFVFKKMLASAPMTNEKLASAPKISLNYTLEDLAEYRPALARGLRQMLEFEGDVAETFCRDFVVEMDKYGEIVQVPLCSNGAARAVTNSNRREFVDLYVRYLLDTAVARQFEPFKRGFFTVCGGNALSLFRPEEIELLIRGSDEPLDVSSLRAVAIYDNWPNNGTPPEKHAQVEWFWQTFEEAQPPNQRKLLSFITGSDRLPAMGATNLVIRVQCIRDREMEELGVEIQRFPIARTCFNTISLHKYLHKETLISKLWTAVQESEGFGLK